RPNVKHRLGSDYETLSKVNPRLVYTSISGFGQYGQDEDRPGLDQIAQGMSGVMTVNGEAGRGPMRVGLPVADLTAGFMAAYGTVCALYERERSGKGQWVHTSLLQAMVRLMDFQGARYLMKGEVPKQEGNNHPIQSPTNVYQASDGMIIIQASGNSMFRKLCEVIDAPELLQDERYQTVSSRFVHHHELDAQISEHTSHKTVADWIDALTEAGVPSGPIYNVQQCFENEQVHTLPLAIPLDSPSLGPIKIMGYGVNLERTPPRHRSATPEQGAHTDEILAELGYSSSDIESLHTAGAI
ncbi:MAG: CoA transferase, partial [Chloroflexi bacterium]|nr:CoA transferase [Chloroflexota bacterium]